MSLLGAGTLAVVLVRTHSPGNLGSAARTAKAFGAGLVLLSPRAPRDHPDALAFASGAEDVLAGAPEVASLDMLGETTDLVVALTSLRGRKGSGLPPALTFAAVRRAARASRVALVFGPERSGLTTEEVRACGGRLRLDTVPSFPTLNLAQAVSATLALCRPADGRAGERETKAPAAQVARLLATWRETLAAAGYPGPGRSPEVLAELDTLLRRSRPTEREVTLLLGALAAVRRRVV